MTNTQKTIAALDGIQGTPRVLELIQLWIDTVKDDPGYTLREVMGWLEGGESLAFLGVGDDYQDAVEELHAEVKNLIAEAL